MGTVPETPSGTVSTAQAGMHATHAHRDHARCSASAGTHGSMCRDGESGARAYFDTSRSRYGAPTKVVALQYRYDFLLLGFVFYRTLR